MKKIILFSAFFSCICNFGQSINGRLIDSNGQAVSFATVVLNKSLDSSLVKATISGNDGKFNLEDILTDDYVLLITNVGYSDYRKRIRFEGGNLALGMIELIEKTENLDEVVIVAKKPIIQVLPDKTVFNVESTISASGANAFDLLRKAPGVRIDNNGGIIVEGKSGVQFYVDGKLSVLQGQDLSNYLESLQSTDIESIEIITQPSSKYDAAGNAGIINLKLKKSKGLGTNGSLTNGLISGDFVRYNSSVNFNVREKKGNLYATYSNSFGKTTSFINLFRTQSNTQFDQSAQTVSDRNINNVKLGYDYYLNSKHTLGVMVNGNFNNSFITDNTRTPIRAVNTIQNDSVLIALNQVDNTTYNITSNVNYSYADTLGYSFNIDLDYGKYESDRNAFQPNTYFDGQEENIIAQRTSLQETPIEIDIATIKADYEQYFLNGILGVGMKFSFIDTDNIFDFFNQVNDLPVLDETRSNRFRYKEQINAGYINYSRKWEKWNLQIGLRTENTISDGNLESIQATDDSRVKRRYTDFFPSAGLTFQPNQNNQFSLNYSRRIQRPNYESLNPFEDKLNELSFQKGNPFLQPQYANNLKLAHTFKYKLTTSVSYTRVTDFFAQVTVAEGDAISFLTTLNVANQNVYNLGISYPEDILDWWQVYVSINASLNDFEATSPEFLAISQESLDFYGQSTFSIPENWQFEVSGWYSSPSIWGGTYQTRSQGAVDVAVQKRFLNEKLSARLAVTDIFFTSPWRGTTQFGDLFIDGNGGYDARRLVFSLTYDFGRNEVKKARKRKTGIDEENERIGN
ncbi:MAG: TonB-dependent receptor [Bacteroidota bacterium]